MALVVDIGVTSNRGGILSIEMLEIRRLEPLGEGEDHTMEVHPYKATLHADTGIAYVKRGEATLKHRYGDGALVLISNALAALGYPENEELR